MSGLEQRKFNGKTFHLARNVPTKKEAQSRAKNFRKAGDRYARITKSYTGYDIWVRGNYEGLPKYTFG